MTTRLSARRRVAMVAPCPFPSLRGSQVLIRELAESLAQEGHDIHVATYPTAQHLVPVGAIAIHRAPKIPGCWTDRPLGWQKVLLDLLLVGVLLRLVRGERIEILHAHNFEGAIVALAVRLATGIPVVYHAHNALTDELPCYARGAFARTVLRQLGATVDRCVAASADHSIALSDRLGAFLALRGAAGRVAVIPPGLGAVRAVEPAPSAPEPILVYAGNVDPYQDLDVLTQALARVRDSVPDARLVVVTHPAAERDVGGVLAELKSHPGVEVLVAQTFGAVVRALHGARVLICSRGSWSGFPIKSLNYLASGVATVHARGSAYPIEDGVNGLLFDDRDAAGLAGAVLRLLRDPELAARLGRQAACTARKRYAWPRLLPAVVAVYDRVLGVTEGRQPRATIGGRIKSKQPLMNPDNDRIRGRGKFV